MKKGQNVETIISNLSEKYKNLFIYFETFVDVYWNIGLKEEIKGNLKGTSFRKNSNPPTTDIIVNFDKIEILGYYTPSNHSITLNIVNMINNTELDKLVKMLKNINSNNLLELKDNKIYRGLFGLKWPSSTVIHELCHAFRNDGGHQGSAHGNMELGINSKPKLTNFQDSANNVYKHILSKSFNKELISRFNYVQKN